MAMARASAPSLDQLDQTDAIPDASKVLRRLDPQQRLLIAVLQQLSQVPPSSELALVQTASKLFGRLRHELNELKNDMDATTLARCLSIMVETPYLSLPILVVFKQVAVEWTASDDLILQSARLKCIEQAAQTLILLVELLQAGSVRLSTKATVQALVACAILLPSAEETVEVYSYTATRLDRGETCIEALLSTIRSLLVLSTEPEAESPDSLAASTAAALNSDLVAHVASSCVGMIAPSTETTRPIPVALQSSASETLRLLLRAVPIPRVWQRQFPGCFVGLSRHVLRSLRTGSNVLPFESLSALTLLLGIALRPSAVPKSASDATDSIVKQLEALAVAANRPRSTESANTADYIDDTEKRFFLEVNNRVPGPLIVVMNLLTTSRSMAIRKEATRLYRAVLIDTRSCWNQSEDSALATTALEALLTLTKDENDQVAAAARGVVDDCQRFSSSTELIPVSKIVDMMLNLPLLAQSHREMELRAKFRLLSACLSLAAASKVYAKSLRSTVSSGALNGEILRALRSTFDLDFASLGIGRTAVGDLIVEQGQRPPRPSYRYFGAETGSTAESFVRKLGEVLGSKATSVLIDGVVADLFRECTARVDDGISLRGNGQVERLHEWTGAVVVVHELLLGAFTGVLSDDKSRRRRCRLSAELASSLVPVIASRTLLDLAEVAAEQSGSGFQDDVSVAEATRGNVCFSHILLDLICALVDVLGPESRHILGMCLYPLVKKVNLQNPASLRSMRIFVIDRLARQCGYSHRRDLFVDNLDNLVGNMLGQLRTPGGRHPPGSLLIDRRLLVVTCTTTTVIETTQPDNADSVSAGDVKRLDSLHELVLDLAARFDTNAAALSREVESPLVLLQLFDAAAVNLLASYGGLSWLDYKCKSSDTQETHEPWLKLLEPFKNDDDGLSAAEGFTKHLAAKETTETLQTNDGLDRGALSRHIRFVEEVASRCCYLLSHPKLHVQIKSVETLAHVFAFLGWVGANVPEKEDESNGPTTAILRQVHSTWDAISSRLAGTTDAILPSRNTSLLIIGSPAPSQSANTNVAEQRVFLSKLFLLVSFMGECAGDFMATRVKKNVWPCMGKAVGAHVVRQTARPPLGTGPRSTQEWTVQRPVLVDSERGLYQAVMQALTRMFGHRPLGLFLAGLIPTAGTMIIPLLEDDSLAAGCKEALRSMLRIDCDALWRQLVNLAGQELPLCPLLEGTKEESALAASGQPYGKLALAAQELIDFIESLPEQALEE